MNVLVWLLAWSPYAVVCLIGAFGDRQLVTPMVSQIPSFMAKIGSCLNPIIMTISNPRYRNALSEQMPWLGIKKLELFYYEEESSSLISVKTL